MSLDDWPLVVYVGMGLARHAGRIGDDGRLAVRCGQLGNTLTLSPHQEHGASCRRCLTRKDPAGSQPAGTTTTEGTT